MGNLPWHTDTSSSAFGRCTSDGLDALVAAGKGMKKLHTLRLVRSALGVGGSTYNGVHADKPGIYSTADVAKLSELTLLTLGIAKKRQLGIRGGGVLNARLEDTNSES